MALNRIARIAPRLVSALPLIAIGLALANWNARPAGAWAWAAVIVMSVVMIAVQRFWRRALRRSPDDAALVRSDLSVASGVAFGAMMIIIPLALTLANAYGVVDNPGGGILRMLMIMTGGYLAVTGNAMPRMLPPTASLPCDGTRVQVFQRRTGWTWVLCGLGVATAGLALPLDAVVPASMALMATGVIVTIVHLLRLRKPLEPETDTARG